MTAILAVRDRGKVLVGYDSAITLGNSQQLICGPKAIWIGGYLVAVAGEIGGHWEALQLEHPKSIRELCDVLGPGPGAELLIAQGATLWGGGYSTSEGRWSVCEVAGPIALGNGGMCTLGAYAALKGPIRKRMIGALEITARYVQGVGGPFYVSETKVRS